MTLQLSPETQAWLHEKARQHGFERELSHRLKTDASRLQNQLALEDELRQGLNGEPIEGTPELFAALEKEIVERAQNER